MRLKVEWQMYSSAENHPEINPVLMNNKIRHNKNHFSVIICGGRKTEKCSLDMQSYVDMEKGLLS